MKPKILHIIDSFSKGGAEVILAGIIPDLIDFNHHIIYLTHTSSPLDASLSSSVTVECLNHTGLSNTFSTLKKLKNRIAEINPDIIHTHLYFSTIFTRLSNTSTIPIIHTYHSLYYRVHYKSTISTIKKWFLKWVDKQTYKETYTVLHVSETQKKVNDLDVGIKTSSVIYNYVEDDFFKSRENNLYNNQHKLKIICVGNLKTEKNHILLLEALTVLKHIPIHVNICGEGIDHRTLQEFINKNDLPVTILGMKNNILALLEEHDLFVSCSVIEGFGISIVEAMASEMPMIISDISTFKEITENKALFFESKNAQDLADKIEAFYFNPGVANTYILNCKTIAKKYRKYNFVEKLNKLYHSKIG